MPTTNTSFETTGPRAGAPAMASCSLALPSGIAAALWPSCSALQLFRSLRCSAPASIMRASSPTTRDFRRRSTAAALAGVTAQRDGKDATKAAKSFMATKYGEGVGRRVHHGQSGRDSRQSHGARAITGAHHPSQDGRAELRRDLGDRHGIAVGGRQAGRSGHRARHHGFDGGLENDDGAEVQRTTSSRSCSRSQTQRQI